MSKKVQRMEALGYEQKKSPAAGSTGRAPAPAPDDRLAGRQTAGPHLRLVPASGDPSTDFQPVEPGSTRFEPVRPDAPDGRATPRPAQDALRSPQLRTVDVYKSYRKGTNIVPVLRGVSLRIRPGELLAVVGQSGSGKSTLLHILGTLDSPDKGEIHYDGRRIDNLPRKECDRLRNGDFGMIFQFYHLLPELTTLENVLAPLMIAHGVWPYLRHRRQHTARAKELLELVRLDHRLKHRPQELSGGEMQRAAIARALVNNPRLLLADEPTGNLDQSTGQEIIRLLRVLNRERNLTIEMVTHDQSIAGQADRIVQLTGGRIA
jgi:lipoprotein-releasing system ATP-binding protein